MSKFRISSLVVMALLAGVLPAAEQPIPPRTRDTRQENKVILPLVSFAPKQSLIVPAIPIICPSKQPPSLGGRKSWLG